MNPQALRELFPAPAHSQEITAYKTEHGGILRHGLTFQAVILPSSKSPGQNAGGNQGMVQLVCVSLGLL